MSPITIMTPDTGIVFTSTVVISGIAIVLGILIILILVFFVFGKLVSGAEKRAKIKAQKKKEKEMLKSEKPTVNITPMPTPVISRSPVISVEEGISGEVVAAIAAAVAVYEGPSAVVRSVRKVNAGCRNAWANAAVHNNTRPF